MNTPQTRLIAIAVLLCIVLITGYSLSRSGRPFNSLLLTGHKLIALAAGVIFVILVLALSRGARLNPTQLVLVGLTGLFFLTTIASGGVVSAAKTMPILAARLHSLTPYLTVVSGGASLYLLLAARLQPA